ncbi:MAG: M43 family zinc metalloprotease [Ignavibacteria bacterium]|jgi:hypothetical protein|nr:M43 family zinc metalloprotease [Ignavibacteria bacterium]
MRLRAKIIVIFSLILTSLLYSQEEVECLTEIPQGVTIEQAKSGNLSLYKRNEMTPPLRLAIHIVRNSQGQYGISGDELNYKISKLNYYFSQALFRFYIYSIDTIDSDIYYTIDNRQEADQLRMINNIPGCINIYFVYRLMDYYGLSSFSPRFDRGPQGIIVKNTAPETTLPHEMGHYFDLFHTYQIWEEQPGGSLIYENIARDGSCRNCEDAGDLLCDTPADPSGRVRFSTIDNFCNWSPVRPLPADGCGQTNYNPLTNNMMITEVKHCRTTFTEGQKNRMNETLMMFRKELTYPLVYLMNVIKGENAGGTLSVNENTYPSGTRVALRPDTYTIRTNNERFSNYRNSGKTYKHNNWNKINSDYLMSRQVPIDTTQNQWAWFEELAYSKIKVLLEGDIITNKGVGQFKDPWYVFSNGSQPGNYWINFISEYEPNGKEGAQEKGVFLNQGYNPINNTWTPPYYSVKADAVQNIQLQHNGKTHKFYFQNWSASPQSSAEFQNANALETGVVFRQEGVVVSANYKGSLLSNQANALSNTSQRKVIRTSNGHLHLFYISMGRLWYEKSVNNGTTFYAPQKIDDLGDEVIVSSFSVDYVGNRLYIISQLRGEDNSSILRLYEIDENGNVSNFPDSYRCTINLDDQSVDAMPLVGANYGNILFVWKSDNNTPLKLIRFRWTGSNWERSNIIEIPNTTGRSINPSLSLVKSDNCSKVYTHLVWEERNSLRSSKIHYIRIAMIRDYVNWNEFENYRVVTDGMGYELTTKPTIVEMGENNALIGFVGLKRFEEENLTPEETKAVLTMIPFNGVFYSFGDDVQSVSINRCNTRWTFAWTRGNDLPVQYVDSRDIRVIYQLGNLRGVDVHITNGIVPEDMYAFVINTSQLPYSINYRAMYGDIIPEELVVTDNSREGIVSKEGERIFDNPQE